MEFGSYPLAPRLFNLLVNRPAQSISSVQHLLESQPRSTGHPSVGQMMIEPLSGTSPNIDETKKQETQKTPEQTSKVPDPILRIPSPARTVALPTPSAAAAQDDSEKRAEDPQRKNSDVRTEGSGRHRKSSESTLSEFDPSDLSSVSSVWSEHTSEAFRSSSPMRGSSEQAMRPTCAEREFAELEGMRENALAGRREKNTSRRRHNKGSNRLSTMGDSASSTEAPTESEALPVKSLPPGRPKGRLKGVERDNPDRRDRAGRTPLIKYANLGDLESCEVLLELGATINVRDNAGWTALHEAALAGHYSLLNLLLETGAEVNVQANNGDTPLHDAVQNAHMDCVQALLEDGADPEIPNEEGVTPTSAAEDEVMVELLRRYQAQWQAAKLRDGAGRTALHRAAAEGILEDVLALLRYGGEADAVDFAGRAALHEACSAGHADIVRALLSSGAAVDIGAGNDTPLHNAVKARHLDCLRDLLAAGADPWVKDRRDNTVFDLASEFPQAKDMLSRWKPPALNDRLNAERRSSNEDASPLSWRAGTDVSDTTSFAVSSLHRGFPSSRRLWRNEQDAELEMRQYGSAASGLSLRPRRRAKCAEIIMDGGNNGSNYSGNGSSSSSPLAADEADSLFSPAKPTAAKGVPSPTKRKKKRRTMGEARPSSKERKSPCKRQRRDTSGSGITPLHLYASKGDGNRMDELLTGGADPSPRDNAGYTPLHEAALRGHAAAVQMLIAAGADVTARGYEGDTPLHDAAQNGHLKVYSMLVRAGADEDALNVKGQRPRDFVTSWDDTPMMKEGSPMEKEERKRDKRRRSRSEIIQPTDRSSMQGKSRDMRLLVGRPRRESSDSTGEYRKFKENNGIRRPQSGRSPTENERRTSIDSECIAREVRRMSELTESSEFKKPFNRVRSKSESPDKGTRNLHCGSSPASVDDGTLDAGGFFAVKGDKANRQAESRRHKRKKIELSFVGYQRFDQPGGVLPIESEKRRVADERYLPLFVVQLDDGNSDVDSAVRRHNGLAEKAKRLPTATRASLRPLPGKAFFVLDLQLHLLLGFASVAALRSAYPRLARREVTLRQKRSVWARISAMVSMLLSEGKKESGGSEATTRSLFCGSAVCFLRLDEVVDVIRKDYEHLVKRLTAVNLDMDLSSAEKDSSAHADYSRESPANYLVERRALSRRCHSLRKRFPGLPAKLALKKSLCGATLEDITSDGRMSL